LAKVKELIENSPIPDYIHVALLHVREEMPELAESFSDLPDSAAEIKLGDDVLRISIIKA